MKQGAKTFRLGAAINNRAPTITAPRPRAPLAEKKRAHAICRKRQKKMFVPGYPSTFLYVCTKQRNNWIPHTQNKLENKNRHTNGQKQVTKMNKKKKRTKKKQKNLVSQSLSLPRFQVRAWLPAFLVVRYRARTHTHTASITRRIPRLDFGPVISAVIRAAPAEGAPPTCGARACVVYELRPCMRRVALGSAARRRLVPWCCRGRRH